MGVHIFTKIKNADGWKKKKNAFFSYFISVVPDFSYMDSFRKCAMFCWSIPLNIVQNGIEIKQYGKVKYLGFVLDQSLSGESMALNVIDKVNSRLKFLQRQNRFLTPPLHRLLCNALLQPLFIMLAQLGFQISQKD